MDAFHLFPQFTLLSEPVIRHIIDQAVSLLEQTGIHVNQSEARSLLCDHGATEAPYGNRLLIRADLVESCLQAAPSEFEMYDRAAKRRYVVGNDNQFFNPGSSAIRIFDVSRGENRPPVTDDLIALASLTNQLSAIDWQSTALVPSDVPPAIADRYRLLICLLYGTKPIVSGTFSSDGFFVMRDMLLCIRGSDEKLCAKPLAIFDCCPKSPLAWGNIPVQNLIDCARNGIPACIVPMPLLGATAPGWHAGFLVQLVAEILSGVVIHQLASPGAQVVWGGSPAVFDMTYGTTPIAAIESMMLTVASCRIGRYLHLPTMGYLGLSDATFPDARAGFESGIGALLAALGSVNIASGPGMMNFQRVQCKEKLVIDNEICSIVHYLKNGITSPWNSIADEFQGDIDAGDYFLTSSGTIEALRSTFYKPTEIINRTGEHSTDLLQQASEWITHILEQNDAHLPEPSIVHELNAIMEHDARQHGANLLPIHQMFK